MPAAGTLFPKVSAVRNDFRLPPAGDVSLPRAGSPVGTRTSPHQERDCPQPRPPVVWRALYRVVAMGSLGGGPGDKISRIFCQSREYRVGIVTLPMRGGLSPHRGTGPPVVLPSSQVEERHDAYNVGAAGVGRVRFDRLRQPGRQPTQPQSAGDRSGPDRHRPRGRPVIEAAGKRKHLKLGRSRGRVPPCLLNACSSVARRPGHPRHGFLA